MDEPPTVIPTVPAIPMADEQVPPSAPLEDLENPIPKHFVFPTTSKTTTRGPEQSPQDTFSTRCNRAKCRWIWIAVIAVVVAGGIAGAIVSTQLGEGEDDKDGTSAVNQTDTEVGESEVLRATKYRITWSASHDGCQESAPPPILLTCGDGGTVEHIDSFCIVRSQQTVECPTSPVQVLCFGNNSTAVQLDTLLPSGSYHCDKVVSSVHLGYFTRYLAEGISRHDISVQVQDESDAWIPISLRCPPSSNTPSVGSCSTQDATCRASMSCTWALRTYVCGGEDVCSTTVPEMAIQVLQGAQWSRPTETAGAGESCITNIECQSGICVQGTCQEGLQDVGEACERDSHCVSHLCSNHVCTAPFQCGTSGASCSPDQCGLESAEAGAAMICCSNGTHVAVNRESYCSNLPSMTPCLYSQTCASGVCGLYGWQVGAPRVCCSSGKAKWIPDPTKNTHDYYCTGLPVDLSCYMGLCSNNACGSKTYGYTYWGKQYCCPSGSLESKNIAGIDGLICTT